MTDIEKLEIFQALGDQISTGIFITDWERGTFYTNRSLRQMSGLSEEECAGFEWARIIHPEDRNAVFKLALESVQERKKFSSTFRIINPGGELKWIKVASVPLEDVVNVPAGRIGTVEDVTERMLLEKALRESEWAFQGIANMMDFGVSVINRRMEIIFINSRMREWFPEVEFESRPLCFEVYNDSANHEKCEYCPATDTFRDGKVHENMIGMNLNGETRTFRVVSSPVKEDSGEVEAVVESIEDMTGKLEMERSVSEDEKAKSISLLTGGIAHDYRNILTSLMGNISLIKDKVIDSNLQFELIQEVEQAGEKAKRLTQQLESISRCRIPVREKNDLAKIIRQAVESVSWDSTGSLVDEIPDDLSDPHVDAYQVDRLVQNIVLNSVQAMSEGDTLTISAENVTIEKCSGLELSPGEYIKIEFVDTGSGMEESDIDKVFDSFYTTKDLGTGLGMTLCRMIVKNHKGEISIESSRGEGTKVSVYLPLDVG